MFSAVVCIAANAETIVSGLKIIPPVPVLFPLGAARPATPKVQ